MEKTDTIADPRPASLPAGLDSATLLRLIEEVRNEPADVNRNYDRVHNRHNR
jgi:aryl carrier-like protein